MKLHMFICLTLISYNALFGAASSDSQAAFNTIENKPIPTLLTLCAQVIAHRSDALELIQQLPPAIKMRPNERSTGPLNIYTTIVLQHRMRNNPTHNCMQLLDDYQGSTKTCLALSPDSKTLASGSWYIGPRSVNTLKLWDIKTGTCTHTLNDNIGGITALAFSSDGATLASVSRWPEKNIIKLRNAKTGECFQEIEPELFYVSLLAFSSDRKLLAVGSALGKLAIFNLATMTCIYTLEGGDTIRKEAGKSNPLVSSPLWSEETVDRFRWLGLGPAYGRDAYNLSGTILASVAPHKKISISRQAVSPDDLVELGCNEAMQRFLLNATTDWSMNEPHPIDPQDPSYLIFIEQFPEFNNQHFFTVSANDNHLSSLPEDACSNKKQRLG